MKKTMVKIISIITLALILIGCNVLPCSTTKAATTVPTIAFVGVDHSPLIDGDTETFQLTSINASRVQYRVYLYSANTGREEELTNGYTLIVDAKTPYEIKPSKVFTLGKYELRIMVRAEGSNKEYDSKYTAYLNCVNRDSKNRVYANGNVLIDKTDYKTGEKVVVNGIQDIGGITGPYLYRLHLYNATTNTWIKNVTTYADKIEWTPTEPGTYVLDIYANTMNSTTWENYMANKYNNNTYGTYEAWKLKVINVTGNSIGGDEVFNRPDISRLTTIGENFDLKDGKFYFKGKDMQGNSYSNYLLSEKLNPNINKQIYNVTKSMINDKNFVETYYSSFGKDSCAGVALDPAFDNRVTAFIYAFYEYQLGEYNSTISLQVNTLSNPNSTELIEQHYVDQLKTSLIALYGLKDGTDTFNYIYKTRTAAFNYDYTKKITETKTFGNVKITYTLISNTNTYYFTLLK